MNIPFKKSKQQGRVPRSQPGKPKSAFSYYAGDTTKKNDSVRTRRANEQRISIFNRLRLIPTIIAVTIIVLSVAFSTTLSTDPTVTFSGGSSPYRTVADYKIETTKILKSSIFNKSKLSINTAKTQASVLSTFPELDAATVTLPVIGRRPTVTMHVRRPALLLTTSTNAYVLDVEGRVVAEASQLLSGAKEGLLTVQDQSGLAIKVGSQALTSESVTFIMNVIAQLADKKLVIVQATLPTTPNEIDIRIKDVPYFLKADMTGDARLQTGAFLAARESGVEPAEYMDIRVEEKVFYK